MSLSCALTKSRSVAGMGVDCAAPGDGDGVLREDRSGKGLQGGLGSRVWPGLHPNTARYTGLHRNTR